MISAKPEKFRGDRQIWAKCLRVCLCVVPVVLALWWAAMFHGLALAAPPAQTLEEGLAAYRATEYSRAARIFRPLAEGGVAEAQYWLGYLYFKGRGVRPNDAVAARFFLSAAEQGHPLAQNALGYLYDTGTGVESDPSKALHWYRQAASAAANETRIALRPGPWTGHRRDWPDRRRPARPLARV